MIHLNDFVASQVQKEGLKSQPGTYYFFQKWNTGIILWRIVPEIMYHCFVSVGSITTLKQLAGYSQDVIIHCSRYSLISWGNMSVPNCQWVVTHKTWSLIWFTKDCTQSPSQPLRDVKQCSPQRNCWSHSSRICSVVFTASWLKQWVMIYQQIEYFIVFF